MITGAIFDVDGTLIDSMGYWNHAGEHYIESLGLTPKPGLCDRLFVLSMEKSGELLQQEYQLSLTVPEIVDGLNAVVLDFYLHKVQLKPGIAAYLQGLAEKGIPMTVATTSDRCVIKAVLDKLGVLHYFQRLFTCSEVGVNKSRPDVFIAAQEHMHTDRSSTWVFEDAFHGAKTALTAGFPVAGVYDAYSAPYQEDIHDACTIFLPDFSDFQAFYRQAAGNS